MLYRFARPKAVADIALEDDTVALGETESLVGTLQGCSIWHEPGENGRVSRAPFYGKNEFMIYLPNEVFYYIILPFIVNDLESASRIFGHSDAAASKNAVRSYKKKRCKRLTSL